MSDEAQIKARDRYRRTYGLTWAEANARWPQLEPGGPDESESEYDEPVDGGDVTPPASSPSTKEFVCDCGESWDRKSDLSRHFTLNPAHRTS